MPERIFAQRDILPLTNRLPGVYCAAENRPSLGFNLVQDIAINGVTLWFHAVPTGAQVVAATTLHWQPKLRGIACIEGQTATEYALPIVFAPYLTELRAKNQNMTLPCMIFDRSPEVPAGYVRLPHLVAYENTNAEIIDSVLWELLTQADAERWFRAKLPDQTSVEHNLSQLLVIRAAIRRGDSDDRFRSIALALKQEGRYLSILFVYQHPELFKRLFA